MATAQPTQTVRVHYTGKLDDGSVFDSSREREPLEFKLGEQTVIPGFEQAVIGMETGETKTVRLEPAQAYGAYRDDMILEVPREQFPDNLGPMDSLVGRQLEVRDQRGQTVVVVVKEIGDQAVKLDANHPLAGQALTFEIELMSII